MITIATFDNQALAHIAKGRLESEGIQARLADDHLVQTDWLYGAALGGIKIQVPESQAARARSILEEDHSRELDSDPGDSGGLAETVSSEVDPSPMVQNDAGKWSALAHLAAFAGLIIPLGHILGPVLAWLGRRNVGPQVDREGKEAVNFQVTVTLYALAALALAPPPSAYALILALFVLDTVLVLYAALRANRGAPFRYPLTIRLLT